MRGREGISFMLGCTTYLQTYVVLVPGHSVLLHLYRVHCTVFPDDVEWSVGIEMETRSVAPRKTRVWSS